MATIMDLKGTSESSFLIGLNGAKLIWDGISLKLKEKTGTTYLDFQARYLTGERVYTEEMLVKGNIIELNSDASGLGFDYKMIFARPSTGMSADVTYTFPNAPTNGYFLTTDASGNLSWAAISSPTTTDKVTVDETSISLVGVGPQSMFTLPANAIVLKVEITVDSAFDNNANIVVSKNAGTLMGIGQSDLSDAGPTKFVVEPNDAASVSSESITYSLNNAPTTGSGKIRVHYVIPA
jgi:hypothetical protein